MTSGIFDDLSGMVFGKLSVIERDTEKNGEVFWICKCSCGRTVSIRARSLKVGDNKTCGCGKHSGKHGLEKHKLYNVWNAMVHRCCDKSTKSFFRYGGRGIFVCSEWLGSVSEFITWAENNGWEDGMSIDRIDNDGPYSPWNCRFISPKDNSRLRPSNRLSHSLVKKIRLEHLNGASNAEIGRRYGIPRTTIAAAVNKITWSDI